jgi:hypothetical protein
MVASDAFAEFLREHVAPVGFVQGAAPFGIAGG